MRKISQEQLTKHLISTLTTVLTPPSSYLWTPYSAHPLTLSSWHSREPRHSLTSRQPTFPWATRPKLAKRPPQKWCGGRRHAFKCSPCLTLTLFFLGLRLRGSGVVRRRRYVDNLQRRQNFRLLPSLKSGAVAPQVMPYEGKRVS